MGRSPKVGLDYFRLDVQLDTKFELIEAEFGLTGFAVVVRLYQRIYGGAGYYCEWDDEVALVFASRNHMGANAVSEIVKAAIKRKLFDQNLFEKYHILTSHGIQEWYFEAVSRREQVEVIREYLLIPADRLPKNVNINRISADINRISADINPHRRVKQSIAEDSKAEHSIEDVCAEPPDSGRSTPTPTPSGFDILLNDGSTYNVPMENIEVYKRLYPGVDVEQQLRNMVGWSMDAGSQRKTRGGVKRFITRWLIREQNESTGRNGMATAKPGKNPALDYPQREYHEEDYGKSFFVNYDREFGKEDDKT